MLLSAPKENLLTVSKKGYSMTIDQRLQELRRVCDDDKGAALRLMSERSRVEGPGVWLELLSDRLLWNAQPPEAQYQVIAVVGQRLGSAYELAGVRVWECAVRARCPVCNGTGAIRGVGCSSCRGAGKRETPISHRLATFRHVGSGMELNLLPGGRTCLQSGGCPSYHGEGWKGGLSVESRKHCFWKHGIKPFLLGRYPVTHKNLERGFGDLVDADELPAVGMPHDDAHCCLEELGLRLPTSAEWEHGCRAGSTTRFFWGDEMDDSYCWHAENSGGRERIDHLMETLPMDASNAAVEFLLSDHGYDDAVMEGGHHIGTRAPRPHAPSEHDTAGRFNAFGLVDVLGNVWERCADGSSKGGCFRDRPDVFGTPRHGNDTISLEASLSSTGFRAALSIPGMEAP